MAKRLLFSDEARNTILKGVEQISSMVKVTLGPKGRNVCIEKKFGPPQITKDGVTVAREVELEDPLQNMGADMVKEVAQRTADEAGDGTTTATILTEAIYKAGLKSITAGANPMALKRGIDKAVAAVVLRLMAIARPVDNKAEIQNVARIASNNDAEIGMIISDAMDKVGKDGVVTVEESKTAETTLTLVEGMQFTSGWSSPYFINKPEKGECILNDCLVLLCGRRLFSAREIIPLLEKVNKANKSLLVIAETIDGEAMATLVVNKVKGGMRVCSAKPPLYADRRRDFMGDIAIMTGGEHITEEMGTKMENVVLGMLGHAKTVRVTKDDVTIVEGAGKREAVDARANIIKESLLAATTDYDREKLQDRLARLTGGIAVINVGAKTETEMKEKKDRIDDALHATKAAIDEGIVPGGGCALLRAGLAIDDGFTKDMEQDEQIGVYIVRRALMQPLEQIAENAGKNGETVVGEVLKMSEETDGYDAETDRYIDLVKEGIIDPVKVTRAALQNAASIAGLMLTTEGLISDIREEDPEDRKRVKVPQFR